MYDELIEETVTVKLTDETITVKWSNGESTSPIDIENGRIFLADALYGYDGDVDALLDYAETELIGE